MSMEEAFRAAVHNVARHGDTDIFPFPVDNHVFHDRPEDAVKLLTEIHADLNAALAATPPLSEGLLAAVGYTGFRWATQIDPLWNTYFLALVISIGDAIEAARIPVGRGNVFSYRFKWDHNEKTMFDRNVGWVQFQQTSVSKSRESKFVLVCDISDFYPRIYHHRLENALHRATENADQCWRLMKLLTLFSNNVSYGLPVGGPAARLLSELLLNRVDRLLLTNGIDFCRFADDYHVFADSAEDAYRFLVFISEKLLSNEGLLLQKAKTRVMSSEEFLATSEFATENEPDSEAEREGREFLRLRLHFDPYSSNAEEEYDALREEVARFDVLGMLGRELRKTRVQQNLARKLIGSLRLIEPAQRDAAVESLAENLHVLYPVFPSIMVLLKATIEDLGSGTRSRVLERLRVLVKTGSHIMQVPTHTAFAVRVLAYDRSEEADEILDHIYRTVSSSAIRRDVILSMARRGADYWISDVRRRFSTLSSWEQTALIVASFILGDEGKHWRSSVKAELTPMQDLVRHWAAERASSGNRDVPV